MKRSRKVAFAGYVGVVVALSLLAGRCTPSAPKSAKQRGRRDLRRRRRGAEGLRRRPATWTRTTCSRRAGTPATSTSTASRRCATSRRFPSSRRIPPPATASTTTRRRCSANLTWGDVHHPSLSETNGDYDGRWLFVNEINGRIARIDLRDFKTKEILGPLPNVSGNHASSFVTPNTEYTFMATRFSIPIPKGTVAPIEKYATDYKGVIAGDQDRSEDGPHDAGLRDPDAAVRLRPRRRGQEGRPTAGCSSRRTTPSAAPASSRSPPRSATATTSPRSTGAPRRRRPPTARAT